LFEINATPEFENLLKSIIQTTITNSQSQSDSFGKRVDEAANAVTMGGKLRKFRLTRKKRAKKSNKKTKSKK